MCKCLGKTQILRKTSDGGKGRKIKRERETQFKCGKRYDDFWATSGEGERLAGDEIVGRPSGIRDGKARVVSRSAGDGRLRGCARIRIWIDCTEMVFSKRKRELFCSAFGELFGHQKSKVHMDKGSAVRLTTVL